tara:strand:- start:1146 stop:1352 length:207 start_codon:yes stop_codon:yes gene_type:complete
MKLFFLLFLLFSCSKIDIEESKCKGEILSDYVCIEIYQPVCGCDKTTYSNECYANSNGIKSWDNGPCK